jgi:hypothetical protein
MVKTIVELRRRVEEYTDNTRRGQKEREPRLEFQRITGYTEQKLQVDLRLS